MWAGQSMRRLERPGNFFFFEVLNSVVLMIISLLLGMEAGSFFERWRCVCVYVCGVGGSGAESI